MSTINLILVDDHEIVRDGLRALLLGHPKIKVIGEATQAKELFDLLKVKQPDIVILDIALPGMSGIDIARVLQNDFPYIKVLMLSANTQENYIVSAVKAGALGFLPKNSSKKEFLEAVESVFRDKLFFGKNITNAVFQTFVKKVQNKAQATTDDLSERELQVLEGFAEGLSYKQIADKLNITARTVESHKKSIFEKLNFENNVDLIKYAIKQGIIILD